MFEAFLPFQPESAQLLSQQLSAHVFPQSVLLSGDRYTGRMSIALEIARVLSCTEDARNTCQCASCKDFSVYGMSNVVALGNRNHATRIEAAIAMVKERKDENSYLMLIRTVRIMLLQFHGALFASQETKSSALFESAASVNDVLIEFEEAASAAQRKQLLDRLEAALKPLAPHVKRSSPLTISQVRSLQDWIMQTSFRDNVRCIIFEGVEESTEGARNSLLKLLEEPPKQTYIIVISENPARLLPTILSRLQRHQVRPLMKEATNRLIAEFFDSHSLSYTSLEHCILSKAGIPCEEITKQAQKIIESLCTMTSLASLELDSIIEIIDEPARLEYFLRQFQQGVREQFLLGKISYHAAHSFIQFASEAAHKAGIFNQNRRLLVESLYYRLQEVV